MAVKDKEVYNEYMNRYMNERYDRRKQKALKQLGNKCVKCGSDKDLQFDHISPQNKEYTICKKLASVSEVKFQEELKKCQLLCVVCHQEKTLIDLGQVSAKTTHGTLSSYRYCKCVLCKKAQADYMKIYSATHIRKRDR